MKTNSGRPPHRSQRAELPHWAPTSGTNVKALVGPGMLDAGAGDPAIGQVADPLPGGLIALTPAPKRVEPGAKDLGAEGRQLLAVGRYGVVRKVAAYDAAQPSSLRRDRVVTAPHQGGFHRVQRRAHPLRDRMP